MRRASILLETAFFCATTLLSAATGKHLPQSTLYPRLIRLEHAPGALQGSLLAKTSNRLFRSVNEGRTFTFLTTVPTVSLEHGNPTPAVNAPDKERCCSTIYELPRRIGHFKAGTLLYSGSFLSDNIPAIEIFMSTDQGGHWMYLSTPMRSGDDHHGLWEPAFSLARDGSLVMFVSDETNVCCSQKLVQMRTRDLRTWSAAKDTVASVSQIDRPGMAIVSQVSNGTFLMSYEVCGPSAHCEVYTRTSMDGWNFGDAASFGTRVVTITGEYLAHAPTNLYDPESHQVLLSGQVLYSADGTVSPSNGQLLLTSTLVDGSGPWHTTPAPVKVPGAYDNYCPNYSSALLPVADGLLELASDYDEAHMCTSYFATRPVTKP